ncbi:class A beta-lactamase-related serine hydrolase [Streptomyces sp. 8K308]|uniref:serine hydrolase domain-containing protein n=1 Tax=Streptomyces sp. 8K308 TaxID=2530388 RepID=UPI00104347B0|nr:serine hydrolase domain-containing protein [Streptomyces sp. 8K308]TDC26413.1 class A beta-lactamase-related serine hydrolase [Streptomyces sp. 8K308]
MSTTATIAGLLNKHIGDLVADQHAPAAVGAAIRGADQSVAVAGDRLRPGRAHRDRGRQPVCPDTLFALGSLTRTFTTLLLAELAVRGEVSYDDPIDSYLPPGATPLPGPGAPRALVDLATHTAGLPRLPRNLYPRGLRRWRTDPYAGYRPIDLYRATARLPHQPRRTTIRYSTFGVGLLGQLLANAAGTDYAELLAERVLRPLGMRDTQVPDEPTLDERAAHGHRRGHPFPHWHFDALAPSGALYSTAADMLRYLRAQLNPATVVPSSLASAVIDSQWPRRATQRGQRVVGLGWDIRVVEGRALLWHTGATGGFTAFAGFSPDADAGVAVLANTTPTHRQPVIRAGRRLFRALALP